jgi:hypothetical protein
MRGRHGSMSATGAGGGIHFNSTPQYVRMELTAPGPDPN